MASSLIQLRVDDKLKEEATNLYEKLGLDLPTAIRMFLTRSVQEEGVPFKMTLKKDSYKAEAAVRAMREISRTAEEEGISEMTLEEINAEISAVRNEV